MIVDRVRRNCKHPAEEAMHRGRSYSLGERRRTSDIDEEKEPLLVACMAIASQCKITKSLLSDELNDHAQQNKERHRDGRYGGKQRDRQLRIQLRRKRLSNVASDHQKHGA